MLLTGRHCCLFCTIKKEELVIPLHQRDKKTPRTLLSLKEDYGKFEGYQKDNKKAKLCNNVISPTLFNIPINQVN